MIFCALLGCAIQILHSACNTTLLKAFRVSVALERANLDHPKTVQFLQFLLIEFCSFYNFYLSSSAVQFLQFLLIEFFLIEFYMIQAADAPNVVQGDDEEGVRAEDQNACESPKSVEGGEEPIPADDSFGSDAAEDEVSADDSLGSEASTMPIVVNFGGGHILLEDSNNSSEADSVAASEGLPAAAAACGAAAVEKEKQAKDHSGALEVRDILYASRMCYIQIPQQGSRGSIQWLTCNTPALKAFRVSVARDFMFSSPVSCLAVQF